MASRINHAGLAALRQDRQLGERGADDLFRIVEDVLADAPQGVRHFVNSEPNAEGSAHRMYRGLLSKRRRVELCLLAFDLANQREPVSHHRMIPAGA